MDEILNKFYIENCADCYKEGLWCCKMDKDENGNCKNFTSGGDDIWKQ